jgi:hypothetical protein
MSTLGLPTDEFMALCIAIGVAFALLAIVVELLLGVQIRRYLRELQCAELRARAHVRTVVHRLADHRARR